MVEKYMYVEWLKARGLQPRTIEQYEQHLKNLMQWENFDQTDVDEFLSEYKGNVVRSFVKSYKAYLLRNPEELNPPLAGGQLEKVRNLIVEHQERKQRKNPKYITEQEALAIYNKMPNPETKLMLLICFYCGLRREELLNVKAQDFNINDWEKKEGNRGVGLLTLIGKGGKEGFIPVTNKVMQQVYDSLSDDFKPEKILFPDINPRRWNRILSRASKEAIGRHVNPHLLRHSRAMDLRAKGFAIDEIKEFLRHSSISTTQLYSRVTPQQLMEKFEEL